MLLKEILLEQRERHGWSLRRAATRIGISHTYLAALERGTDTRGLPARAPTPEVLRLIADGYGVGYETLMESCRYLGEGDTDDIRVIARACRRMTNDQVAELKRYAKRVFPEVFEEE